MYMHTHRLASGIAVIGLIICVIIGCCCCCYDLKKRLNNNRYGIFTGTTPVAVRRIGIAGVLPASGETSVQQPQSYTVGSTDAPHPYSEATQGGEKLPLLYPKTQL